jgi:hypothetical protein
MAHLPDPYEVLTAPQRMALGLARQSWSRLRELTDLTVAGATRPEETLRELGALVGSVSDLASASTRPLQEFVTHQRELADALVKLAEAQAEVSKQVATLARRHAQALEALEHLSAPVLGLMGGLQRDAEAQAPAEEKSRPRRGHPHL